MNTPPEQLEGFRREVRIELARKGTDLHSLATSVGLSYSALWRRMSGEVQVSLPLALRIADALDVPLHVLLERASSGVAA